jgi:hypothetical protein
VHMLGVHGLQYIVLRCIAFLELHSRAAPRRKDHTSNGDWEWEIQETKSIPKSIPYAYEQPCFKNSWRPTAQDWPEQLQRPTAPSEPNLSKDRQPRVKGRSRQGLAAACSTSVSCLHTHVTRCMTGGLSQRRLKNGLLSFVHPPLRTGPAVISLNLLGSGRRLRNPFMHGWLPLAQVRRSHQRSALYSNDRQSPSESAQPCSSV